VLVLYILIVISLIRMMCRYKTSERLISADTHSNTANFKHTYSVEIPPVCKDDLIALPRKIAQRLGNISQICLCYRMSSLIHLVDPLSGQGTLLSSPPLLSPSFA